MLTYERRQRGNAKIWCKYCNVFVQNHERCISDHNNCVTHKANVQKYEKAKRMERVEHEREVEEQKDKENGTESKENQHGMRSELEEEYEMARNLYGDDILKELTEPKEKINRVAAYNSIMKSLPTKVAKKHRTPIKNLR